MDGHGSLKALSNWLKAATHAEKSTCVFFEILFVCRTRTNQAFPFWTPLSIGNLCFVDTPVLHHVFVIDPLCDKCDVRCFWALGGCLSDSWGCGISCFPHSPKKVVPSSVWDGWRVPYCWSQTASFSSGGWVNHLVEKIAPGWECEASLFQKTLEAPKWISYSSKPYHFFILLQSAVFR